MSSSDKFYYSGIKTDEIIEGIDRDILRFFSQKYILVYYRDLGRDICTIRIRRDLDQCNVLEEYPDKEDIHGILRLLIENYVHPEDRSKMLTLLDSKDYLDELKEKSELNIYYRRKYNGEYIYVKLDATIQTDEDKHSSRLIMAVMDANEDIRKELQLKDEARRYQSGIYALGQEYSSVFYVNLDTKKLIPYNLSDRIEDIFGDSIYTVDYEAVAEAYIESTVYADHMGMMRKILSTEYIKQNLAGQSSFTRIFLNKDKEYCEMKCVRIEQNDGSHVAVMGFSVRDEQIRHEIEDSQQKEFQLTLLDGLSREYHTVWLVRMNHEIELYRTTGVTTIMEAVNNAISAGNYEDALEYYISKFVVESDRDFVREQSAYDYVRANVPETGIYVVTYKRINVSGEERYHQMCFAKATNDRNEYFNIILAFRDVDRVITEEMAKREAYRKALQERDIDVLTGIKNRYSYESSIENYADCECQTITCIYIDVNGLHELNNTLGHDAGDEMICFMANCIIRFWGKENTFRTGGDEFVAFLFDYDSKVLEREIAEFESMLAEKNYSASIGYYTDSPDGMDIGSLIKIAENKMYAAKRKHYSGRNDRRRKPRL